MFSVLSENKIDSVEYIENGNATDKTRNNMIIATTTETLKKLLSIVHDNFSAVTIA
jgi:predicted Zn-dependent protease